MAWALYANEANAEMMRTLNLDYLPLVASYLTWPSCLSREDKSNKSLINHDKRIEKPKQRTITANMSSTNFEDNMEQPYQDDEEQQQDPALDDEQEQGEQDNAGDEQAEDDAAEQRSPTPKRQSQPQQQQKPKPARAESAEPSVSRTRRRRRRNASRNQPSWYDSEKENHNNYDEDGAGGNGKQLAPRQRQRQPQQYQQQQQQLQMQQQQQQQTTKSGGDGGKNPLKLRLDLNLEVEVTLKARIHGDLTLALLYVQTPYTYLALQRFFIPFPFCLGLLAFRLTRMPVSNGTLRLGTEKHNHVMSLSGWRLVLYLWLLLVTPSLPETQIEPTWHCLVRFASLSFAPRLTCDESDG